MEKISRERFIQLGTALGVSAACASLAACGGGASSGSGNSGGGSSSEGDSGGGNSGKDKSGGGSSGSGTSGSGKSGGEKSGGEGSGGKADDGGKKDSPKQPPPSDKPAIASESEVAPGSAVKFTDAGSPAVLVHLDNGDFVAYSAVCTHQGCTVAYNNGQLACPCHGSLFDPAAGAAVITGPATSPLPEIPVKVEGGDIVKA